MAPGRAGLTGAVLARPDGHTFMPQETAVPDGDLRPADSLADGTELIGAYRGSGRVEIPYLVRRADGRMLEVSPLLYQVASCLDGRRQPNEIARLIGARSDRPITADGVSYLIEHKLRPLCVLRTSATATPQPSQDGAPTPLLGLHLRAAVLPTSLVRTVSTVLRPLFAPLSVAVVLVALVAVDGWMLAYHGVGSGARDLLFQPGLLLLVAALTVLAGAFHELGHATACRYGGAEPGAIGLGIYLIWPVFYNDLTDSYRLSRAGRVRADLGGIYFNILFILLLAGGYGLTGFEPLLLLAVVQHLVILQQFLPFVRLDGYYLVSDLAGEPDLFWHMKPTLLHLLSRRRRDEPTRALRPRARAIVTAWVAVTFPLLVVGAFFLVVSMPHILRLGWTSLSAAGRALLAAARSGDTIMGLVAGFQVLVLSIPLIGLSSVVLRSLLRLLPVPGPVPTPGRRREPAIIALGALIGILLVLAVGGVATYHVRSLHAVTRLPPRAGAAIGGGNGR